MDTGHRCPIELVSEWLPFKHENMIFRVVVREIESWLLADNEAVAEFLGVRTASVDSKVELLADPKRTLVNLARTSRKSGIKESLVPQDGVTASEGILYNVEMTRFVKAFWNAERARANAPSLDRCIVRLNEFVGR